MVSRWLSRLAEPRGIDFALTAGLLAWGLPNVPWWWEYPGHAGTTPQILGTLALSLAMSIPFLWRRRFPLLPLALALAVLVIRAGLGQNLYSAFAAVLVGCHGLGAYSTSGRPYARWLGWLAVLSAITVVVFDENRLAGAPFALIAAALLSGDAARARHAEHTAARNAAEQAERARIARDLHDLVAHKLSAIAMQAGAARIAMQTGAPDGPRALDVAGSQDGLRAGRSGSPPGLPETVERQAREALIELNHLLGALRREPADDPVRPPAPTLADVPTLAGTIRAAGVPVELTIEGCARPVTPGLQLAGYRIIAEALSNVARHAPGAPTTVLISCQPKTLSIEVRNRRCPGSGRLGAVYPARAGTGGRGVLGMRERAELYGGNLDAGPTADGGFGVRATIPYDDGQTDGGAAR